MKIKAYYAHSKLIYGTRREISERAFISRRYQVLCPNRDIGERGSMEPYLQAVASCQTVIVSEVDGYVGRGVFEEIKHALKIGHPVLALRASARGFTLLSVRSVAVVDSQDWRYRFGKLQVAR